MTWQLIVILFAFCLTGMIEFTDTPSGLVTPFCVAKKNGKLRLSLDCRDTNRRFKAPPPLALGTCSYFYSLQLPSTLRRLFSTPAIPSGLLRQRGVSAEQGGSLDRDRLGLSNTSSDSDGMVVGNVAFTEGASTSVTDWGGFEY